MHEPSLSHNRPRFGCRLGTFSPSCLQIRSTRLWFTSQPSMRSRFVICRYPYLPKPEPVNDNGTLMGIN